jgi:23S rRNA pseudouridine1911/1915/1917 synthase
MNNLVTYIVSTEQADLRLDVFLGLQDVSNSRAFYQNLIKQELVLLDGEPCKPRSITREGAVVSVSIPQILLYPNPQKIVLDILFEDSDILVINKPAGISVHPTKMDETNTVVNALLEYLPEINEVVHEPDSALSRMRPGIVHRLDKETSGVLIIAKTLTSLQNLTNQFHEHTLEKRYLVLVDGDWSKQQSLDTHLIRKSTGRENMFKVSTSEEGREAISHFTPKEWFITTAKEICTLTECEIETGRTHQIRIHCKYAGHPVLGDNLYCNKHSKNLSEHLGITRQLLHAASLKLQHPISEKTLLFSAPLPSDFKDTLTKLKPTASVAL